MFIDFCVGLVFSVDLPQQSMNSVDIIHEITITTDMHDKWSTENGVDTYFRRKFRHIPLQCLAWGHNS